VDQVTEDAQVRDWEPEYGFCGGKTHDLEQLAYAVEMARRRVCAYSDGRHDARCDCKYRLPGRPVTSEQTGCPELRELVHRLLHRPETFAPAEVAEAPAG
jgi:hypothetical protein